MNGTAFNISMVLRTDATSAKAGLAEVAAGLKGVSAEAGKASTAATKEAVELQRLASEAAKAAMSHLDLAAATTPLAAIWRATDTAAEALRISVAGLNNTIGAQANDFVAARQEAALYQSMLDDVRASFNPLFAVSRQYEQQLERIAEAERLGGITAREAAQARAQAAQILAPAGAGMPGFPASPGANSMHTANIGAQGFDIGVTAAMGMNPMMIGMQQGTQLVQVMQQMGGGKQALQGIATGFMSILNPMSLATIGIVAFGAAGIQALMSLGGETRSFDDALADLTDSTAAYAKSSDRARMSAAALREEFGSVSEIAKQLLQDMADLDRRAAGRDATAVVRGLAGKNGLALQNPEGEVDDLRAQFGLSTWKQESWDLARGVRDAYLEANRAEGDDARLAAVQRLKETYLAAAEASGDISKNEDAALKNIQETLDQLMTLKGRDENAAGNARADEMVRELQQRVALEQVALQYGQESREYRAAEQEQLRANTVLELQKLGLTEKDQKAKEVLAALAGAYFAQENAAAQARRDAQREYLQGQTDEIAGLQRELALIGASNADRARANALAEADIEIRNRSLSIDEAREVKAKAIAKAEAEITLERQKALRAVQVQTQADAFDGQIALARDPVSKANIEFEKEFSAQIADGVGPVVAYAEALRARNRAMQDTTTSSQTQIADMMTEVAIRRDLAGQVATGMITSEDANRMLREELELRPLIAAAARAEGAEKRRLLDLVEGMRVAYAAMAAEERRQSQNDYLRGQAERTSQLQLELALLGQTAEVRTRVLALAKAEQDIQRLGLTGDAADEVRRREEMNFRLAQTIEEQANAWQRVQSAGEAAIDGVLDKLRGGDIKGAMAELLGEIEKGFFDLAIRNPLKNALLGTNLGTWEDIGGWSGIMDRFSGRAQVDEKALVKQAAMPVQSMMVTAANVVLSGNLSGIGAANANLAPLSGANANVAPLSYGSLPGSADVQTQIWQFFAAKGLAPHQIAGIMGNVAGESNFNPLAQGDHKNGVAQAFGLFQHNDRKGKLFDFIGGQQNLGDVQKQLEFAWHELMTSENGAFKRLMASSDVQGATDAWMRGFERPSERAMVDSWGTRLGAANEALAKFGSTTQTAAIDLGALGNGMGVFGQALSGFAQGGGQGALSGLLGGLGTIIAGAMSIPGFASGGDHRGGWRIVGENGPELEATGPSRIYNASQTREIFASRAQVASNAAASIDTRPVIQVVNNSSAQVTGEVQESTDAQGRRQYQLVMSDAVAQGLAVPGGQAGKVMRSSYGVQRPARVRP